MSLDQNPHPTVTRLGVRRLFNVCVRVFCAPNATILLVNIPAKIKITFIWKYDFFCQNRHLMYVDRRPLSEAKTHWLVNWLQLLNQLNFVWRHTKVFMQNLSQWCLRNVQLLGTTVNWCWRRLKHTFCHSSNILGCMHCFWLFTLWLIDEDARFFHFFHKITNIRSWQCFSSSNICTQHYHDFQSNIAIFPSVVQSYTQPYSFNGGMKLIICKITHELSVTIHEISTRWKQNVRWRSQYLFYKSIPISVL